MPDPWPEMALEQQFRPLVTSEPSYPATLAYLEKVRSQVSLKSRAILDYEISQLTDALLSQEYARALVRAVWGPESKLPDHKNDQVASPEELVNAVASNSALNE